jgi:hypothetical protein
MAEKDERDARARLETRLAGADWSGGLTKAELSARLADDPLLRSVVGRHAPDELYFSARDVLSTIPDQAWETALGDTRRGTDPPAGPPSQASDQVVSVTTRAARAEPAPVAILGPAPDPLHRAVPLALSATMEGLGQAYNRQPSKALAFAVAGLGLSTASGLNTWLARHVFRVERARLGPERVRPFLLGLWAATYLANLLDAWSNAGILRPSRAAAGVHPSPPVSWADVAGGPARAASSPSATTDQFPIVGDA